MPKLSPKKTAWSFFDSQCIYNWIVDTLQQYSSTEQKCGLFVCIHNKAIVVICVPPRTLKVFPSVGTSSAPLRSWTTHQKNEHFVQFFQQYTERLLHSQVCTESHRTIFCVHERNLLSRRSKVMHVYYIYVNIKKKQLTPTTLPCIVGKIEGERETETLTF